MAEEQKILATFTVVQHLYEAAKALQAAAEQYPALAALLETTGLNEAVQNADDAIEEREQVAEHVASARSLYAIPSDDDVEIDDVPMVAPDDDGVWVAGWLWVGNEGTSRQTEQVLKNTNLLYYDVDAAYIQFDDIAPEGYGEDEALALVIKLSEGRFKVGQVTSENGLICQVSIMPLNGRQFSIESLEELDLGPVTDES